MKIVEKRVEANTASGKIVFKLRWQFSGQEDTPKKAVAGQRKMERENKLKAGKNLCLRAPERNLIMFAVTLHSSPSPTPTPSLVLVPVPICFTTKLT